jgi:hypothetical protein
VYVNLLCMYVCVDVYVFVCVDMIVHAHDL